MKTTQTISLTFALCLALGLTACGKGYSANSGGGTNVSKSLDQVNMESLDQETVSLDADLTDAQNKLNDITILNLTSSSPTPTAAGSTSLSDKITEALDKVVDAINKVVAKKNEIRAKIAAIESKLDPNNPEHVKLREKIDKMLSYLDALDAKLHQIRDGVVALIDAKVVAIEGAIAKLGVSNPALSIIASIAWGTLKPKIVELRDKIAAIQL